VVNGTVIITLKQPTAPPASLMEVLEVKKEYKGINKGVLLAKVPENQTIASTIALAMMDPAVDVAEPDRIVRAIQTSVTPNDPGYSSQWGMCIAACMQWILRGFGLMDQLLVSDSSSLFSGICV
jgi:hypothetical protein